MGKEVEEQDTKERERMNTSDGVVIQHNQFD
jgi:hypothetical protein